jgi:hypothetical protein
MMDAFSIYSGSTLDECTARELAGKQGVLALDVVSLDGSAAETLADFQGEQVRFDNALPKMDEKSAQLILKLGNANRLSIAWLRAQDHLPNLTRPTFLALSRYADAVDLTGFGDLDTKEAEILSQFHGAQLLVYASVLSVNVAKQLAMAKTDLLMVSVKQMHLPVAAALSASKARDELQITVETDTIDSESAEALSRYRGNTLWVAVNGPPSANTMRQLARFAGHLVVGLPGITPDVAKILAQSNGTLELLFDEKPDADVSRILSGSSREITNLDDVLS